jgi:hypothetical protein
MQILLDRGEQNDWFGSGESWIEAIVAASAFYICTCAHPGLRFLVPTPGADVSTTNCPGISCQPLRQCFRGNRRLPVRSS